MTVLVTGGAGFIGNAFIRLLLGSDESVRAVCADSLTYAGNMNNLADIPEGKRFCFVKADITDRSAMDALFSEEKPRIVVNFAAESHVDRSIEAPELFLKTNVIGTEILLDESIKHGVKRFHQVSTDEVYGDLPLSGGERFTESSPLKPSSPYAVSKAAADMLCLSYFRTYGVPVTISRSSNNYGPRQHAEKFIPHTVGLLLQNKPAQLYGTGENVRDWIHVDDHCRAILRILRDGTPGEVFNVGADCELSNRRLAEKLGELVGCAKKPVLIADRKGHDLRYALDSGKLRSALGWKPERVFDVALAETVQWYDDRLAGQE